MCTYSYADNLSPILECISHRMLTLMVTASTTRVCEMGGCKLQVVLSKWDAQFSRYRCLLLNLCAFIFSIMYTLLYKLNLKSAAMKSSIRLYS